MLSEKLPININFGQGVDTKTDPKQVEIGKFLSLVNSKFTKAGLLEKRDGYESLPALPNTTFKYLTTFSQNLTAIGSSLQAYSSGQMKWIDKGDLTPVSLSTQTTARSAINIIQCDSVVAPNGLVCTAFTEKNGTTLSYFYSIQDSSTTQNIVPATAIPVPLGVVNRGTIRVFQLGGYFIVGFDCTISGTEHLQYIAISTNDPTVVTTAADIAADYNDSGLGSWDGIVANGKLYIAYDTSAGGQQVAITYLDQLFNVAAATSFSGLVGNLISVCADISGASPVIYAVTSNTGAPDLKIIAVDSLLHKVMNATLISSADTPAEVTLTAQNGIATVVWGVNNHYSYDSSAPTEFLHTAPVTLPASLGSGTVGSITVILRSLGLASKGFLFNGIMYMLAAFDDSTASVAALQPTYFLIDINGNILSRLAYQNGGGYVPFGLPQAQLIDSTVYIGYLFKDLVQAANKSQGVANFGGIYSQTGANMAAYTFGTDGLLSSEIGNNLHFTGGYLFSYDGSVVNENGFHLYPSVIELSVSHMGGSMTVQDYFYQVIYQWTDAQGNVVQSAPSIPVMAASSAFSGSSNSVTINIPSLRLTGKPDVKVLVFRWSAGQQEYFQATSITAPLLNDPTNDSVQFVDTQADSDIAGNSLIYTTGGVIENTPGPACADVTLFDTRLFLIEAEDGNVLDYSKQVIKGVPVDMSDLFTLYIAPNAGTNVTTGKMKCIHPMDDKLVIFKKNAIYYLNGAGPDNTGSNSQYSQPIFVTSTVGCENKKSIVLTPMGLIFQSDKGIWLLDRNLGTEYIGAPVEEFNQYTVNSANALPQTTMIVFTLSNGVTLMYDYFFNQWNQWEGNAAASSTVFEDAHTVVSDAGLVSQQTPGIYTDNGNPVLMSFTTGWINLAKIMGFQRLYNFMLVGQYFSPHKLFLELAYNYVDTTVQTFTIQPNNFSAIDASPFGDSPSPFGSPTDLEQWQINPRFQKCQAFQISLSEQYDPTKGVAAGAGLSISGINMIARVKRTSRPLRATQTIG